MDPGYLEVVGRYIEELRSRGIPESSKTYHKSSASFA
jgi:hypothetical protein